MKEKFIKYPVITFFPLTFLISWPLFIIVMFIFPGNMMVEDIFGSIATFGPALLGVIVSTATNKKEKEKHGNKKIYTFILSCLFSANYFWICRGSRILIYEILCNLIKDNNS